MVEHHLAKVGAAGSNPVSRSIFFADAEGLIIRSLPLFVVCESSLYLMGDGDGNMRVVFMVFRGLFGILLALFTCFSLWLFIGLVGSGAKEYFRIDPSQGYKKVEDCGQILFYDRSSLYRRRYWGLQKVYTNPDWFLPYNGDMVWYGEDGGSVYVWITDQGIQRVDLEDFSVEEILSQEDVEKTGTINESSRLSKARYCRDWNDGAGFTYWKNGLVHGYEYKTGEITVIGRSEGDYGLTQQGIYCLESAGDQQNLLMRRSSTETDMIASNVSGLTVGPRCGQILYYSREDQRYHLYHTETGEDAALPPNIPMINPVISPDGRSILYQTMESRSSVTDDEDCYYRVMDLVTYEVTTIYSGYRAWLGYIW